MDVNEGIEIIETILGRPLNAVEIWTITGVWDGKDYRQMEKESQIYSYNYLRGVGSDLWRSLSIFFQQELGFDRPVTKKKIKSILLWYKQERLSTDQNPKDYSTKPDPPSVEWGDSDCDRVSTTEIFYGREAELVTLSNWCLIDRCRLICLLGMGGMGKSSLARKLVHQIESEFDLVMWRSLVHAPKLEHLLPDLLGSITQSGTEKQPPKIAGQLKSLVQYLKQYRCLIILDQIASILQPQSQAGQYLPDYDGYARFFQSIGELPHQSCVILISSEKPQHLGILEMKQSRFVRTFNLGGLGIEEGYRLVQELGAPEFEPKIWQEIYNHYSGNPLALKIATITAIDLTGGGENIYGLLPLLHQPYYRFERIEDLMARQFDRLSSAERQIVYWLAIEREPMTIRDLRANLISHTVDFELVSVLQSLQRRCIILRPNSQWCLESVMMGYVTERLIAELAVELSPPTLTSPDSGEHPEPQTPIDLQERLVLLNSHAIVSPHNTEQRLQIQRLMILRPLCQRLIKQWRDRDRLKHYLQDLLQIWETLDPIPAGYVRDNLRAIFTEVTNLSA
jgi:hypothetical protein